MTAIEWTDATWNPVTGCDRVSPGCAHCYALTLAGRLKAMGQPRYQRDGDPRTSGPGFGVTLHPDKLDEPLRWRKPRMVFVNSMSDLFHEQVPEGYIRDIFETMARAPQHTYQVLTKRPERALWLFRRGTLRGRTGGSVEWPLRNVWLGVSIENVRYTWRADVLREIPAAIRFISAEPLLGSLFESDRPSRGGRISERRSYALAQRGNGPQLGLTRKPLDVSGIDWLIVGGESGGRQARPMHPQWARELRDACLAQCRLCKHGYASGGPIVYPGCDRTAFFFKQWGSWSPADEGGVYPGDVCLSADGYQDVADEHYVCFANESEGTLMRFRGAAPKSGGRLLDGREWNEMPNVCELVPAAAGRFS